MFIILSKFFYVFYDYVNYNTAFARRKGFAVSVRMITAGSNTIGTFTVKALLPNFDSLCYNDSLSQAGSVPPFSEASYELGHARFH